MDNKYIRNIAIKQSSIDLNCSVNDFLNEEKTVVISKLNAERKKYFNELLFFGLVYYGGGIVASVDERIKDFTEKFISKYDNYRCFDLPQLNLLNKKFKKYGKCIGSIAEFFLPDIEEQVEINENIEVKIFLEDEIQLLYKDNRFGMALGYDSDSGKKDVLAVVGYINGQIAGVAGASNDCETMWQIGIDIISKYRRLGVATTLTKILTDEVIKLGKVPFYCTSWSNIASKRNAVKCGYKSAWVEMTAIDIEDAMKMIGEE